MQSNPSTPSTSWYGRGDLPIGTYNKKLAAPDNSGYLTAVAKNSTVDSKPTMMSLDMYKKILAAQPNSSVVISSVGFTNNLFDLLKDPKGKQLVEQKVKLLVLMGGGSPGLQMEAMTLSIYENVYFGLMHVLTSGELMGHGNAAKARPNRRNETDVMDFYIGTSRDAVTFDRSWINASKPLLERGGDDDFDRNMINVASEIITRGDEHWIYYQGSDNQHHDHIGIHGAGGKLGLATLPLDRFISQQAQDKLGTVTTKPFKLEGGTLQVNVDARKGRFYAEVLDTDGKPIQDFTASEAKIFHGVDKLRLQPQWKNNSDLSSLKGKRIRLRFHLYDANLYSFQILDG